MSSKTPVRDASNLRSRFAGSVVMLCAVALLISAAMAMHRSHRAIQRDEDILTNFRSEFASASDEMLRVQAEQRGAVLMAAAEPQYLFSVRREIGPWYCSAVEVKVAVSAHVHDGRRDVHMQKLPVGCL